MGVHTAKRFSETMIASIADDSHSGMIVVALHTASIGELSCLQLVPTGTTYYMTPNILQKQLHFA